MAESLFQNLAWQGTSGVLPGSTWFLKPH